MKNRSEMSFVCPDGHAAELQRVRTLSRHVVFILSAPGTAIQAFDQDVRARTGRYSTREVIDSLALYRILRSMNLKLLHTLNAQEWDMFGVDTERGIESLLDIAMYFAGHDINHFRQIELIRRQLGIAASENGAAEQAAEAGG